MYLDLNKMFNNRRLLFEDSVLLILLYCLDVKDDFVSQCVILF